MKAFKVCQDFSFCPILKIALLCILFMFLTFQCADDNNPVNTTSAGKIAVSVEKWYAGHKSAVSLTLDGPWSPDGAYQKVVDEVWKRNLHMDFETVTSFYQNPDRLPIVDRMREDLIPHGIHFFGHGHWHINHDKAGYDSSYVSFKKCYDLMKAWGLNPKAYAYPYSAGHRSETQQANHDAGFLFARGGTYDFDKFFISAGDHWEPENWYFLPSVPVSSQVNQEQPRAHEEIVPLLDEDIEKGAWIIIMLHSVGVPNGYAYYPMNDFQKDLDYISTHDIWCDNLDVVGLYCKERNHFSYDLQYMSANKQGYEYQLKLSDGLDNQLYDQPLTINFDLSAAPEISSVIIVTGDSVSKSYHVENHAVQINMLPDEKARTVFLEHG